MVYMGGGVEVGLSLCGLGCAACLSSPFCSGALLVFPLGRCGRDTSERALFLNTMSNIAQAIAGDADQPSLLPSFREKAFGSDLLQLDTD